MIGIKKYKDADALREAMLWVQENASHCRLGYRQAWEVSIRKETKNGVWNYEANNRDFVKATNEARLALEEFENK